MKRTYDERVLYHASTDKLFVAKGWNYVVLICTGCVDIGRF